MAGRLNALAAGLLVIVVIVILLMITLPDFVLNWSRAIERYPYVKVTAWDLPYLLAIPVLILSGVSLFLKAFNRSPKEVPIEIIKIAVIWILGAIAVRVVYGALIPIYLGKAGYSKCQTLSDPSLHARSVWVIEQFICVANSGHVRDELIDEFDKLIAEDGELSIENVQEAYRKVDALWNEQRRLIRVRE